MNAVSVMLVTIYLLPVSLSQSSALQRRWGHQVMVRTPFTGSTRTKSNKVRHHFYFVVSAILV